MTKKSTLRAQLLTLVVAGMVVLSVTTGFAAAATTTDLTVSITDDDNTLAPGETTTVEIAVATADGGVGAASYGIELSDPSVAEITDVDIAGSPVEPAIQQGGSSADIRYFQADTDDSGEVIILTVTLEATGSGSTSIDIVENSEFNNIVLFDENGAGYTLDSVGSATLTVEEVNQEPDADAGDDQTVGAGDTVTLDGSESNDQDGSIASYSWTELTSSGVLLSDDSAEQPTFTAPDVDSETTLEFQLEVTDDDGESDTDTVSVTVQPPDAANFQVSNLQAPASATQGDLIDVSADVENIGGQAATKAVEFRVDTDGDGSIDDESAVLSQDVQLDAGASTTVTFEDVPTGGLSVGTLTHGLATADDSATAQITIEEPAIDPNKATTVSLNPVDQTTAVGVSTTYNVVVDNAQGGVGAGEIRINVADPSVATITDIDVTGTSGFAQELTDAYVEVDYFGVDTADSGSVVIATVTVEGASDGSTDLSIGPTSGNSEVLLFDEEGTGYDVTGTNEANLDVEAVQFLVDDLDAPEKAAVGSTVTVTADVTNDGSAQSTQPVEFQLDVDGDGTLETVATEQVTLAGGETAQVSFDVVVPEDASFGVRDHGVFTAADSATAQIEFTPPAVNSNGDLPADLDGDGLYEDVNGDGDANVGDAQALFSNRDVPEIQNYTAQYDFNGDGAVNVGDAQALFNQISDL